MSELVIPFLSGHTSRFSAKLGFERQQGESRIPGLYPERRSRDNSLMTTHCFRMLFALVGAFLAFGRMGAATPTEVWPLWPGEAPGVVPETSGQERILEGRPRPFYQLADVRQPTVSIYRPSAEKANGTAVLLCPGGGLQRLALEHEGLEMTEHLLAQGFTVGLLKYRVPAPIRTAAMDAQRALGMMRHQAMNPDWAIDPEAIGLLGFSAGGEIGVWLATHPEGRLYEEIDASDAVSSRPDFVGLIYPGGLLERRSGELKGEISSRINAAMPPLFVVHALGDSSLNSLALMTALKRAGGSGELHLYQRGVHGFGGRPSGQPIGQWLTRWNEWLGAEGYRDGLKIRGYAKQLFDAVTAEQPLPRLGYVIEDPTLEQAYRIQRHYIRRALREKTIGGFKGAGASAGAQKSMGIPGPLTGVLFAEGRLDYSGGVSEVGAAADRFIVETEIGYVLGVDIGYEVLTDQQMQDAVQAILPVIELPDDLSPLVNNIALVENVSANIGSERFLVGPARKPSEVDPNALPIRLTVDGKTLHETNGNIAKGGQWHNLRTIVNQLVRQGYEIPQGAVVISGALGGVHKAVTGRYVADFSDLGRIEFRVR